MIVCYSLGWGIDIGFGSGIDSADGILSGIDIWSDLDSSDVLFGLKVVVIYNSEVDLVTGVASLLVKMSNFESMWKFMTF